MRRQLLQFLFCFFKKKVTFNFYDDDDDDVKFRR